MKRESDSHDIHRHSKKRGDIMIEIRYFSTVPDYNNNFDILFCLRDYIPDEFFQQHEEGAGAELYFFISLFYKSGIFD